MSRTAAVLVALVCFYAGYAVGERVERGRAQVLIIDGAESATFACPNCTPVSPAAWATEIRLHTGVNMPLRHLP